jgi:beta-1,4-N-acetylglucosaminyltransferase
MKIGVISSCGGHLTEVRALRPLYEKSECFYVLNDRIELPADMVGKTTFIRHSERDWLFLVNLWEAWKILREKKPDLLISTGAGLIVPFSLVGKLLGIRCLYIEIGTQVKTPSLTGRLMYRLADRFFYQWPALEKYFPYGVYGGTLL